jgi:hypothetical protein
MKAVHKVMILGALAGAGLYALKCLAARQREDVDAFDAGVGHTAAPPADLHAQPGDAGQRASIDDVPVVQPAEPYEPGQPRQPQDLRIAQNVLE